MDRTHDQKREMLLVPIGKVLVDVLNEIAVALRKTYGFHVRIGRLEEPATDMYSDERRQFDAERLINLVLGRKREGLLAVLGVVDGDVFLGEKSFVFGFNHPGKGVGLISLTRLRQEYYKKPGDAERFMRRAVTESISQVGLALGFPPCAQKKCALTPVTSLWRLDEKQQMFCEVCQRRVDEKLHPASAPAVVEAAGEEELEADASAAAELGDLNPAAESSALDELASEEPVAAEIAALHQDESDSAIESKEE